MTYSDLIQLYFERTEALQNYWTLYVVVIGGLLAFSSLRKEPDLVSTALVSVLFLCFAYKNLGAIGEATVQRHAVLAAMEDTPSDGGPARPLIEPTLNPPALDGVQKFHWTSTLLTLAAIWAMERRRRKA